MGQYKKIVKTGFITAVLCVTFVCLKQCVVHHKLSINQVEVLQTLQKLEEIQVQNLSLLIQEEMSDGISQSIDQAHNISGDMSDDQLRKATRKWFDNRPRTTSSNKLAENHPLFPGYIIENPDVCKDEDVDILVYLYSTISNVHHRRSIRESWCNSHNFIGINLKVIFIIGRSTSSHAQFRIETEYATYGDIIQGNISDVSDNLTHKAILMLTWVNKHCSHARYVVKVDDDMFVDMYRVISEIVPKLYSRKSAVACVVVNDKPIHGDFNTKWYLRKQWLANRKLWPTYCSGYFSVLTGDVIPKLYSASLDIHELIPFDDIYLFGLLPEKTVNLQYIDISGQISATERPKSYSKIWSSGKSEFISFRVKSPDEHTQLWSLRTNKLSHWEKAHSNFIKTFRNYGRRSVQTL